MHLPGAKDTSVYQPGSKVWQESTLLLSQHGRTLMTKPLVQEPKGKRSRRLNAYHLIPDGKRLLSSDEDQEKML